MLVEALKAGATVKEFWEMTPREAAQAVEAFAWRLEREQRGRMWLAWHTAACLRAKRLPRLEQLIAPPPARSLTVEEREARQDEFAAMVDRFKRVKVRRGD